MSPIRTVPDTPGGSPPLAFDRVEAEVEDRALEALLAPGSAEFEAFRLLRAKVAAIADKRPFEAFGFVGAAPGEGASTTAIGLACALAREGRQRVLLVEADLQKPGLTRRLGVPNVTGLAEYLGPAAPAPVLQHVLPYGFTLLSAGEASLEAAERLGSSAFQRLVDELRKSFDVLVFDCPPLTPTADALVLQERLDGLLVVVRARTTPRELVRRAVSHLQPEGVAGVVFNDYRGVLDGLPPRWRRRQRG